MQKGKLLMQLDTQIMDELNNRSSMAVALDKITKIDKPVEEDEVEKTAREKKEIAHREMAKASFIQFCERNLVVALPLLLKIKEKKLCPCDHMLVPHGKDWRK